MAIVPEYDWELDEAIETRVRIFSRILAAMKDEKIQPCADGAAYIEQFYVRNFLPDPQDPEGGQVDIGPLEDNMLHDSLGFASMAETRAGKIVDFLDSVGSLLADETWRKQVDDEICLRGRELNRIAEDMEKAMAFHDPENLSPDDILAYREFLDRINFAQARYKELVEDRAMGHEQIPANTGLNRAFNIAGKQTVLSIETLRYATCAIVVAEDAMQILLGGELKSAAHRSGMSAKTQDLRDMAGEMLRVAQEALEEGRMLTRDSYTTREYNRPVFRSGVQINRQYPGSAPQ